ncbi:MAG: coenzyme F420-0:L-glutamate ligase [Clostridia bacterium]|nr:coenzyme F420-0:L-glutamate ligase [Clostridia bacterium]
MKEENANIELDEISRVENKTLGNNIQKEDIYTKFSPNDTKGLVIKVEGDSYERFPIKVPVIMSGDDIYSIINEHVRDFLQEGDMIFVSEKIVAISQGRAFKISDIKPSRLANFLQKFVHKSDVGIGLGSPHTMELAIRELGRIRILFAAGIAAITKPFGIKGAFYVICGPKAQAIDGPCSYTIPPYNHYAKLAPKDPDKVAKKLKEITGAKDVVIIDANDIGVNVLGKSDKKLKNKILAAIFKDNPLGQTNEQTPLAIVRKINE